ncbi:hypothetical protein [Nonomuraea sp. NPDC049480]|uniref:hypothetical protein n=1 Tax=Nonomuraea sp. NPDC049480 TaxID=3364353 RepID=UPI0037ACB4E2
MADGARENTPSGMRAVAEELRSAYEAMMGKGERPNGNINQIYTDNELSAAQIGKWSDADVLARAVGSSNAGQKFSEVYDKFIKAYEDVVKAVELSADNHDRARGANEG